MKQDIAPDSVSLRAARAPACSCWAPIVPASSDAKEGAIAERAAPVVAPASRAAAATTVPPAQAAQGT